MFDTLLRMRSDSEQQAERSKDFRNVVKVQVAIVLTVLLLRDLLETLGIPFADIITQTVFLCLGGFYLLMLWDMLRNFTRRKEIIYTALGILLASYTATLIAANPFFHLLDAESERKTLLVIHIALFTVEVTMIYFTIMEIFKDNLDIGEKIWGSACIFFMIGISFGSSFDIICIIQPGSLGVMLPLGLPNYMECIHHSFNIIGGLDPDYPGASDLIKKMAVVEGVWNNLFVVLVVGRLLSK